MLNTLFLIGTVVAFSGATIRVAKLPMGYNAESLDTRMVCSIAFGLAVVQLIALFAGDKTPLRRLSVMVLMMSSGVWFWLATLTYYSAEWLNSIGIHKQLLYAHIIVGIMCWLAADYIRDNLET